MNVKSVAFSFYIEFFLIVNKKWKILYGKKKSQKERNENTLAPRSKYPFVKLNREKKDFIFGFSTKSDFFDYMYQLRPITRPHATQKCAYQLNIFYFHRILHCDLRRRKIRQQHFQNVEHNYKNKSAKQRVFCFRLCIATFVTNR